MEGTEKAAGPLRFTTRDGLGLVADQWGPADGPAVLLLHGGGQTRHAWGETGETLGAEGWRAVALDLRGHGDSDWSADRRYHPHEFAADVELVARALEGPVAAVGASLGGIASLHVAGTSDALAALVLVDITPRIEPRGADRIVGFMLAHPEGFATLDGAADAVAGYLPHRPRPDDIHGLRNVLREDESGRFRWKWDPQVILSFLTGEGADSVASRPNLALLEEELTAAARGLEIPTLLVRGSMSEVVTDESVRHFREAIPHASFVEVEGAGHMVAGDRNDAFAGAVREFLREVFPAGGPSGSMADT